VLHNTSHAGDVDLVRSMLEHVADVCAVKSDGETALHSVCDFTSAFDPKIAPRLAIIQVLLDHGADINARDHAGSTLLHAAWSCAQRDSCFVPDLFNLLLKKGADRLATYRDMRKPVDLIDLAKWMWDEDGLVREKPKPMYETVHSSTRGGRGRGTKSWTRGPSRGNRM
jgi:ankyrin repeat protein